jgi:polyhydroxyalkanoate synthesis regulator phasin
MSDILKKAMNLGFGILSVKKEDIEELIDEMVKKGEIKRDEAKVQVNEIINKILSSKKEVETKIEEIVEKALHKFDIPTRSELQQIQKKLEELIAKLESQEKKGTDSSCN